MSCKTYSRHVTEVHLKNCNLIQSTLQAPSQLGRMKNLVSKAPRSSENAIFNARKIFYNKSVFARFCYLYVNLLNFELFLHNSQIFFFQKKKRKEKKNRILLKTRKITCLFIANKYLHQLPWVDCANVEPSQKKKIILYQDVSYIKP